VARYAFVLGSNGSDAFGKLRFARSDAERIAATLSAERFSFQIIMPSKNVDPYLIRKELDIAAAACVEDDSFIIYFSGHGDLVGGRLMLVLDETVPGRQITYLPVSWVQEARNLSAARNRLLILDCCHAGAATGGKSAAIDVADLGIQAETEVMLLASPKLEIAREFPHLKGSFLTTEMCSFLESSRTITVDLQKVMDHLHTAAILHNRRALSGVPKVPIPFLSGNQQGAFLFSKESRSDLSKFVTIRTGGQSTSVVSLAAATAVEASLAARGHHIRLSPAYIREKARKAGQWDPETGERLPAVIFILEHFGVLPESLWPWTPEYSDRPPDPALGWDEIDSQAFEYRARCFRLSGLDEIAIHLEHKRPVLAALSMHNDGGWMDEKSKGVISAPTRKSGLIAGHAVLIVAADAKGFRFANTWGTGWGDKGFGTIAREVAQSLFFLDEMWAVEAMLAVKAEPRARRRRRKSS
jgi:hypothetical protein